MGDTCCLTLVPGVGLGGPSAQCQPMCGGNALSVELCATSADCPTAERCVPVTPGVSACE
ncbi:MAG TPA: hypothetical protein VGM06_00100 [Polyangiaceae bacterium]